MIPSTFDYLLELITESSRKSRCRFFKRILPGEKAGNHFVIGSLFYKHLDVQYSLFSFISKIMLGKYATGNELVSISNL